jgi:hypothetical protein
MALVLVTHVLPVSLRASRTDPGNLVHPTASVWAPQCCSHHRRPARQFIQTDETDSSPPLFQARCARFSATESGGGDFFVDGHLINEETRKERSPIEI